MHRCLLSVRGCQCAVVQCTFLVARHISSSFFSSSFRCWCLFFRFNEQEESTRNEFLLPADAAQLFFRFNEQGESIGTHFCLQRTQSNSLRSFQETSAAF